jgi:hypothetical protein
VSQLPSGRFGEDSNRIKLTLQVRQKRMFRMFAVPAARADMQTIHIDDLSRNFALNPGEGLKVSLTVPYICTDCEAESKLTITDPGFQGCRHARWDAGSRVAQVEQIRGSACFVYSAAAGVPVQGNGELTIKLVGLAERDVDFTQVDHAVSSCYLAAGEMLVDVLLESTS